MSEIPVELKYTKTHEWVRVEDDASLTIGITAHAQDLLGDMVYVEAPEEGTKVSNEEACAVVESVKAASDIYSPVNGEILAGNEALADAPEMVNSDPYGKGWIFRMKPENLSDIGALMDAESYETYVAEEDH